MKKIFNNLKKYFEESWLEIKKVNWPNKQETLRLTMKVVGLSIFIALILGVIDYVFSQLIQIIAI